MADTAWGSARISGAIQGADYDVVLTLSRAYAFQADSRLATEATGSAMNPAQLLGAEPADDLAGIFEGVNNHWWLEERLLEAYLDVLEELGATPGGCRDGRFVTRLRPHRPATSGTT